MAKSIVAPEWLLFRHLPPINMDSMNQLAGRHIAAPGLKYAHVASQRSEHGDVSIHVAGRLQQNPTRHVKPVVEIANAGDILLDIFCNRRPVERIGFFAASRRAGPACKCEQ